VAHTQSSWFTDEKTFTRAIPVNSQNDRVYSEARKNKKNEATRHIHEFEHFSRGIMVSVDASQMVKTNIVFVILEAKVSSDRYCDKVLRHMGVDRYEKVGGTKTDFHWTEKLY